MASVQIRKRVQKQSNQYPAEQGTIMKDRLSPSPNVSNYWMTQFSGINFWHLALTSRSKVDMRLDAVKE